MSTLSNLVNKSRFCGYPKDWLKISGPVFAFCEGKDHPFLLVVPTYWCRQTN